MSVAKDILIEEYEKLRELSLAELFEKALARKNRHDHQHDAAVAERRSRVHLAVDNSRQ